MMTSTKILLRLYPQFLHPVADTVWGLLAEWLTFCQEQEQDLEKWYLLLRSSCLEHSSIRPSRHYWYEYIQKTTQECTSRSSLNWLLLALLDVSYSGALQISHWLIDWSVRGLKILLLEAICIKSALKHVILDEKKLFKKFWRATEAPAR